jgi:hypothetical protein
MNPQPVIIQVDDEENYLIIGDLVCYNMGLAIAAKAKNIIEAKEIIARVEAKRLKPDIAIITSMLEVDIDDGKKFAKKLRELVPGVKIIAYTHDPEANWGDKLAIKSSKDAKDSLISALEEYTQHKFKFTNIAGE